MSEIKLEALVIKSIKQWAVEEWRNDDNTMSYNERFNDNLETFIDLLRDYYK